MKLVIIKTHDKNIEEKDCFIDMMVSVTQLVREWVKQNKVEAVIDDQGEEVDLEEADLNNQVMKPRTISK